MTTGTDGGFALDIARSFAAPAALVFRLWEDRDHRMRWWGPKDFTCVALESDFRPGGKWQACVRDAQGQDHWMGGVYRDIARNTRIVFTFAWRDGRDQPGVDTLVTVTFSEADGRTLQRFHQAPFVHEQGRDDHIRGWNQLFDKQEAYLGAWHEETHA